MKFTLNWLKDFLETSASLDDISKTLTAIGLEVESVDNAAEQLKDFVVAKIENAKPHPDASKLQICSVNDGTVTRQVICGAANARAGLHVVLAREGVVIPANGMVIKKAAIRGVESNGMLCSLEELGLADSSEGIIEVPGNPALGSPAAAALGLDDAVIDIAITPNRGDCFSVIGVARDLAAAGIGAFKPAPASSSNNPTNTESIQVATNTQACPYFVGCTIRGVKNGESPDWLKRRLTAVGQRPISALVDITNYMLITYGRPLHVYDVRALSGNLQARQAKDGEKILALNGTEYTLDSRMMVIADDAKALGIAGIMGGEASGCQLDTVDVFLESALFDPVSIAHTGQKLEIISDARQRFERGVDTAFIKRGAEIARDLILELCGGVASALVEAGNAPAPQAPIAFAPDKVQALSGVEISKTRSEEILTQLGFAVNKDVNPWQVTPPSWRHDVSFAEDLVEEIIRIHGYNHIPLTRLSEFSQGISMLPMADQRAKQARQLLASRGMTELCSWSFVSGKQAAAFGANLATQPTLQNPISEELSVMRPSLLPHLLTSAARNNNKGFSDLALFECGLIFKGVRSEDQQMVAAGLRTGTLAHQHFTPETYSNKSREVDVFDAKTDVFAVLTALGVNVEQLNITRETPAHFHPGRSMALMLGSKILLGFSGELHPTIVKDAGISGRVAAFEIFLGNIPQAKQKSTAKKPLALSLFMPISRDFAFLLKDEVEVESLRRAIAKAEKKHISHIEIFDIYRGKGVAEGHQSVAVQVTFQPGDHTFTDDEIQQMSKAIIDTVAASTGGSLRA